VIDRRRAAARRVREIASTLRALGEASREEKTQAICRVTGELAGLAEKTAAQAAAVVRNSRRAVPKALSGRVRGRLRRALSELAVTIERTAQVVAQTRSRLAGQLPESAARLVSLRDPDARPIRKGRIDRPSSSGSRPRSPTTMTASSSTTTSSTAPPPTGRSWPQRSSGSAAALAACPARSPLTVVTASLPWSATCTTWACAPWRSPARARSQPPANRSSTAAASTGWSSGGLALKGGSATSNEVYGWDRTRLDGREGAAIWCGHGVFAHNLTKIAALAS
jgi:IS5 family transposase